MKENLLDAVFDNVTVCNHAAHDLEFIADRLRFVGMGDIADRLECVAENIATSAYRVRDEFSNRQSVDLSHSEGITHGLLAAIVNGNLVPTKTEESAS